MYVCKQSKLERRIKDKIKYDFLQNSKSKDILAVWPLLRDSAAIYLGFWPFFCCCLNKSILF